MLLRLLLVSLLAGPVSTGPAAPGSPGILGVEPRPADSLDDLADLVRHAARSQRPLAEREARRIDELLREATSAVRRHPERRADLHAALLDLVLLRPGPAEQGESPDAARTRLANLGRHRLEASLERAPEELGLWLAEQVVAEEDESPRRRIAAAGLLDGRYLEGTRTPLLEVAAASEGPLQEAVLGALAGWPDPRVHAFFLDRLTPEGAGLRLLGEHLERVGTELARGSKDRLRDVGGRMLLTEDWRSAARARPLLRALDAQRAVPVLLEGLRWWLRLGEEGRGSRRIVWDLVEELRRVSGRSLGPVPEDWARWWEGVLDGRYTLPGAPGDDPAARTEAGFFGLNPRTDRVLFVLDRSASMDGLFGTDESTRYDEGVRRLLRFLEDAGPETRFGIALFSDRGKRWRTNLVSATEANLERARDWLEDHRPIGGTQLRAGLREGLRLGRGEELPIERTEVDTVVVLCDGETEEGPGWVRPWLARENERAQLVFHCVQVGSEGDGTLEALAAASGGRFVHVRR